MKNPGRHIGLVLTGGGARAAYQVGVLKALSDLIPAAKNPFSIISGYSAGAINAAALASRNDGFAAGADMLWKTWSGLTTERVFDVGTMSLAHIAFRWIKDRSLGGVLNKKRQITYLLDTSPLRKLIQEKIDFDALNRNVESGCFHAVSIAATEYHSGNSVAFYNGHTGIKDWKKLNRLSQRTELTLQHVLASAAIPIFFPPVRVGKLFYGDGMLRMNSPLSPAIHLGAHKLLVIGIRSPVPRMPAAATPPPETISVSEIVGTVLNGLFFDSLDADIDRLQRINRTLGAVRPQAVPHPDGLREIPVLTLTPQKQILETPEFEMTKMPLPLNVLLKGIGVSENKGSDLLSYLAFEPKFIKCLLKAGYEETMNKRNQILEFLDYNNSVPAENSRPAILR